MCCTPDFGPITLRHTSCATSRLRAGSWGSPSGCGCALPASRLRARSRRLLSAAGTQFTTGYSATLSPLRRLSRLRAEVIASRRSARHRFSGEAGTRSVTEGVRAELSAKLTEGEPPSRPQAKGAKSGGVGDGFPDVPFRIHSGASRMPHPTASGFCTVLTDTSAPR